MTRDGKPHTETFLAVRDALLALDDAERVPIARLFGAMNAPERDLSPATMDLLRTIAGLDADGILRLQHWARTYLNRWGQVPHAAGRSSDLRPNRKTGKED